MKVLLTNDDGIDSTGLHIVAKWAAKHFDEVVIAAPKTQQSGKSHAICIHTPIEITRRDDFAPNARAYCVDSTPVDCVRYATLGLKENYDLVISGINKGYNLGEDMLYSGTVGAIFEASLRGINGIALSTEYTSFDTAEAWLDDIYNFFVSRNLLRTMMCTTSTFRLKYAVFCLRVWAERTTQTTLLPWMSNTLTNRATWCTTTATT